MLCMCQRLSSFYMPFGLMIKPLFIVFGSFTKLWVLYVCMSVCMSFLSSYCKEGTMMFLHKNQRSQVRRFILLSKYFIIRKGVVALFLLHTFHKRKRVIFNEIHIYFSFCYPMIPTHATALFIIADKNGYWL